MSIETKQRQYKISFRKNVPTLLCNRLVAHEHNRSCILLYLGNLILVCIVKLSYFSRVVFMLAHIVLTLFYLYLIYLYLIVLLPFLFIYVFIF